jgi:hypothetical protein
LIRHADHGEREGGAVPYFDGFGGVEDNWARTLPAEERSIIPWIRRPKPSFEAIIHVHRRQLVSSTKMWASRGVFVERGPADQSLEFPRAGRMYGTLFLLPYYVHKNIHPNQTIKIRDIGDNTISKTYQYFSGPNSVRLCKLNLNWWGCRTGLIKL